MRIPEPRPCLGDCRVDVRIGIRRASDLVARVDDVAPLGCQMLQPRDVVGRRFLGRAAIAVQEDDQGAGLALGRVESDFLGAGADRPLLHERLQVRLAGARAAAACRKNEHSQHQCATHAGLDKPRRV